MSDETPWVTRWYRRHWFGGTFVISLGLWAPTLAFYVAGAEGISFDVGATQNATIDFNREYGRAVLDVGNGRERCLVFNFAFVAAMLLWLVVGGTLALALKLRSHRRP